MELPPLPDELSQLRRVLPEFVLPTVLLSVVDRDSAARSRLGGVPLLPPDFVWPLDGARPLDYLAQVDLAEVAPQDAGGLLPPEGILTFFYNLEEQPWGFDPAHASGWHVAYTPANASTVARELPDRKFALPEFKLEFQAGLSVPQTGSRAFERLRTAAALPRTAVGPYIEYAEGVTQHEAGQAHHRMLGHPLNVQGDMFLEAQLASHGIYCGNPDGYRSARAAELAPGADDWLLLLQLDTDDRVEIMWGDAGMIYYLIRRQDLAARDFSRVWLCLQCY